MPVNKSLNETQQKIIDEWLYSQRRVCKRVIVAQDKIITGVYIWLQVLSDLNKPEFELFLDKYYRGHTGIEKAPVRRLLKSLHNIATGHIHGNHKLYKALTTSITDTDYTLTSNKIAIKYVIGVLFKACISEYVVQHYLNVIERAATDIRENFLDTLANHFAKGALEYLNLDNKNSAKQLLNYEKSILETLARDASLTRSAVGEPKLRICDDELDILYRIESSLSRLIKIEKELGNAKLAKLYSQERSQYYSIFTMHNALLPYKGAMNEHELRKYEHMLEQNDANPIIVSRLLRDNELLVSDLMSYLSKYPQAMQHIMSGELDDLLSEPLLDILHVYTEIEGSTEQLQALYNSYCINLDEEDRTSFKSFVSDSLSNDISSNDDAYEEFVLTSSHSIADTDSDEEDKKHEETARLDPTQASQVIQTAWRRSVMASRAKTIKSR